MNIINILKKQIYLKEYFELCIKEWGNCSNEEEFQNKLNVKLNRAINDTYDNLISVLGLINDKNELVGFISLFKTDGDERNDLTPWYATMYVKQKYRGKGYSKILNDAILNEAKQLGYEKVYLKSNLKNYYEKFGAKYIEQLNNGENLFCIDL